MEVTQKLLAFAFQDAKYRGIRRLTLRFTNSTGILNNAKIAHSQQKLQQPQQELSKSSDDYKKLLEEIANDQLLQVQLTNLTRHYKAFQTLDVDQVIIELKKSFSNPTATTENDGVTIQLTFEKEVD